ncbi:hypothetical protein [Streptacidiphilus albus]|nr:hypothetical protein [Streptacidiphilus albus]
MLAPAFVTIFLLQFAQIRNNFTLRLATLTGFINFRYWKDT